MVKITKVGFHYRFRKGRCLCPVLKHMWGKTGY